MHAINMRNLGISHVSFHEAHWADNGLLKHVEALSRLTNFYLEQLMSAEGCIKLIQSSWGSQTY